MTKQVFLQDYVDQLAQIGILTEPVEFDARAKMRQVMRNLKAQRETRFSASQTPRRKNQLKTQRSVNRRVEFKG